MRLSGILFALCAALLSSPSWALLQNGNFESGSTGWTNPTGTATFPAAGGNPGGCAEFPAAPDGFASIQQIFTVPGTGVSGLHTTFDYWFLSFAPTLPEIVVKIDATTIYSGNVFAGWVTLAGSDVLVGPGAHTLTIQVKTHMSHSYRIDNVRISGYSPAVVPSATTTGLVALGCLLGLIVLRRLRRRSAA